MTASSKTSSLMDKLFSSCARDPKGSVHRAWGLSLLFILSYFIMSIVEMISLHKQSASGSKALLITAIFSGIVHLVLAVLGTFVLKRFPTSFAVGFFLGILIILANQNLILFGVFHHYTQGSMGTNLAFSNLSFFLFVMLTFFSLLLIHLRHDVVVAAIDTNATSQKAGEVRL